MRHPREAAAVGSVLLLACHEIVDGPADVVAAAPPSRSERLPRRPRVVGIALGADPEAAIRMLAVEIFLDRALSTAPAAAYPGGAGRARRRRM